MTMHVANVEIRLVAKIRREIAKDIPVNANDTGLAAAPRTHYPKLMARYPYTRRKS